MLYLWDIKEPSPQTLTAHFSYLLPYPKDRATDENEGRKNMDFIAVT